MPIKIEEMITKYFLGLTFYSDNSFARSIENFRSRFDTKFHSNSNLHLALVPSFEIEANDSKKITQELIEELESFFFENTTYQTLEFTGIDVHEYKKNKILFLNPALGEELSLCQESLLSICKSYRVDKNTKFKNEKSFLTIGRFQDPIELHNAIELAQTEFNEKKSLPFKSICLYSKNKGVWHKEMDLIQFEKPNSLIKNSGGMDNA